MIEIENGSNAGTEGVSELPVVDGEVLAWAWREWSSNCFLSVRTSAPLMSSRLATERRSCPRPPRWRSRMFSPRKNPYVQIPLVI